MRGIILSIFLLHISDAFAVRISQKKCQEYETIVPSASIQNVDDSSEIADPQQFPFMAKIFALSNSPEVYFNGLLISENFVLTVAHLDLIVNNSRVFVVLGDYVNRTDVVHQRFTIIQHAISTQDNPPDPENPDNLLLLKLNASVQFNQYVRPVCLSQPEDNVSQSLLEVSWGIHKMLRKERRDLISNAICNVTHDDDPAGPTRMCASRKENGCEHWEDIWVTGLYDIACALLNGHSNKLVAIKAKTFYFSCQKGFPEEYVRISSYIDWIEKKVWPSSGGVMRADCFTLPTCVILLLVLFHIII